MLDGIHTCVGRLSSRRLNLFSCQFFSFRLRIPPTRYKIAKVANSQANFCRYVPSLRYASVELHPWATLHRRAATAVYAAAHAHVPFYHELYGGRRRSDQPLHGNGGACVTQHDLSARHFPGSCGHHALGWRRICRLAAHGQGRLRRRRPCIEHRHLCRICFRSCGGFARNTCASSSA